MNNRIRPELADEPPVAEAVVAEITAAGGTAVASTADIGVDAEAGSVVDTALAHFGRIDIVVNNAGIALLRVRRLSG